MKCLKLTTPEGKVICGGVDAGVLTLVFVVKTSKAEAFADCKLSALVSSVDQAQVDWYESALNVGDKFLVEIVENEPISKVVAERS